MTRVVMTKRGVAPGSRRRCRLGTNALSFLLFFPLGGFFFFLWVGLICGLGLMQGGLGPEP